MDYKKIFLSLFLSIFIFGIYFFIKNGKLIDIKKVELNQENICDYLKQFIKDEKKVPIDLKDDFERCFNIELKEKNNLEKNKIKIIKLKNENNLIENKKSDCLELENLSYSEKEIFESSSLIIMYGHCFEKNNINLIDLKEDNKNNEQNFYIDNPYFNLEQLCPLYYPLKDEKECNLIIDEFGKENCKICKRKGY